jgi:hypothetical protein
LLYFSGSQTTRFFWLPDYKIFLIFLGLLDYTDTFVDYDPLLVGVGPSNPWMTDDLSFWEINKPM